jgi:predicted lipoprotein with Yx(FWY)xxD motif
MEHRRHALFSGAFALTSFVAVGAGAAAGAAAPHTSPRGPIARVVNTTQPTLHTTTARVGALNETILVNARGLPLYYYRADTARKSQVTGVLARVWPPLFSAKPTATGIRGKVVSLKEVGGRQVAFNGHFLYTFVDDSPGRVTGQGISNFFVATPNIRTIGSSPAVKAPVTPSRGYGY